MKQLIILIILFSCFNIFATNQGQTIFEKAVKLYENKDYTSALSEFLRLDTEGIISAPLYANIANCYWREGDVGRSVLYYKKAQLITPDDAIINKKLAFVLANTKDKQSIQKKDWLHNVIFNIYTSLNLNILAIVALASFILVILIIHLIMHRLRSDNNSTHIFILIIFIIICLAASVLLITKWQDYRHNKTAVVISPVCVGYSGPSADYTRVFTIHAGMVLDIEQSDQDWHQVKLANGLGAWVEAGKIQTLIN